MKIYSNSSSSTWSSPWSFFGFTLGLSWLFSFFLILMGISIDTPLGGIFMLLGLLLGPILGGIIFTQVILNKKGRRDYWRRLITARWQQ